MARWLSLLLIFSKETVYTRRTHASSYLRNPTTLNRQEFGEFDWKLTTAPATKLEGADDVSRALKSDKRLVARTEFKSADGARSNWPTASASRTAPRTGRWSLAAVSSSACASRGR